MAMMSMIQPSSKRPRSEIRRLTLGKEINNVVSRNFHSTTLILFGAVVQGFLVLIFPRIWVLLPSLIVLLIRLADTLAVTLNVRPNPYLKDVIFEKFAVIVPDKDGRMADTPADEKVAVLLLVLKLNHPLGFFAPNVKPIDDFATKMARELDRDAANNGFLGQSEWHSVDQQGASQILLLSYWRSIEDIHNYSRSPLHLEAWKWWDDMVQQNVESMKHIGIAHEIFEAPQSRWEAIAMHFQPTGIAATSYLRKGDKLVGGTVDDQWISPVVQASKGKMRTSKGRLNWAENVGRNNDLGKELY